MNARICTLFHCATFFIVALMVAVGPVPTLATPITPNAPIISNAPITPTAPAAVETEEALRREADASARDVAIAEAKAAVIEAGNSRLENWIGIFGILITVLLGWFAILTYRQAAVAAAAEARKATTEEFAAIRSEIESAAAAASEKLREIVEQAQRLENLLAQAQTNADHIAQTADRSKALSDALQAAVDKLPGSEPAAPLPPEEQKKLDTAATTAAATPRNERTAREFRLLMFEARQKEDWPDYVSLAEGMAYLHGENPDDLAFALFGRAYGEYMRANFDAAARAYADYMDRCPNDSRDARAAALNNWGNVLSDQAETKVGAEADALFADSFAKYAAALAIKPDKYVTLTNWGNALLKQATTKVGAEADALFADSFTKCAAALAIKPDMYEALHTWGNALLSQARTKAGAEADALFADSFAKFAAALAIKPDNHLLLSNWGHALLLQARTKAGAESDAMWNSAEQKLLHAEQLLAGSGAYNLACLAGLRGDSAAAAAWLRKAREAGINSFDCAEIGVDGDFDLVRDSDDFKAALADIGC